MENIMSYEFRLLVSVAVTLWVGLVAWGAAAFMGFG
jgi:hypothetical protein